MAQHHVVLKMLRDAGPAGVHTADIHRCYIVNAGQRKAELERLGHVIHSEREQSPYGDSMGARYFLVRDADSGVSSPAPTSDNGAGTVGGQQETPEPASLFDAPPVARGHYDEEAA